MGIPAELHVQDRQHWVPSAYVVQKRQAAASAVLTGSDARAVRASANNNIFLRISHLQTKGATAFLSPLKEPVLLSRPGGPASCGVSIRSVGAGGNDPAVRDLHRGDLGDPQLALRGPPQAPGLLRVELVAVVANRFDSPGGRAVPE